MNRLSLSAILLFAALFTSHNPVFSQPREIKPSGYLNWDGEKLGKFTTALCTDREGNLWVGTEGNGISHRATNGQWFHLDAAGGLSDNSIQCLATDRQGRLWVGTSRSGVSVRSNARWQTYGVLDGPLSERIRDIAISPIDGEIWMATEAGLCRYSDAKGWRYITRIDGLASDQIVAISFAADGKLYAATACDGLSIGNAADDYANWVNVSGLENQPVVPQGEGLPSNQLNDLAIAKDGTVWVATNFGVAKSSDQGKTWFFLRGKNWRQNVEGSRLNLTPQPMQTGAELLEEDWVTKIEPTSDGNIWLGYRHKGFEQRDGEQGDLIYTWKDAAGDAAINGDSVAGILPLQDGAIVATYGSGLQLTSTGAKKQPELPAAEIQLAEAPLPQPAPAPSKSEVRTLIEKIKALPATEGQTAAFYGVDWRTQGNWIGRYGDRYARLYGMQSPMDHDIIRSPDLYKIASPHVGYHGNGVGPYRYIHELDSKEPATLYSPIIGKRRQSEINDGGWQTKLYPSTWDGPDLWVAIQIPAGTQRVALYFHNLPAHDGDDRFRDYVVSLKEFNPDLKAADAAPDLAKGRIKDFWNGGYLQFWVNGPKRLLVKVASGHSHVAILQATLLDQIHGDASPADYHAAPWMGGVRYVTENTPAPLEEQAEEVAAARELWSLVENDSKKMGVVKAAWMARLMAYRVAVASKAPENLLANWRWKLAIWEESDLADFDNTMAKAFAKLQAELAASKQPKVN